MQTRKIWKVGAFEETAESLCAINNIASRFGITRACAKLLYLRGYDSVEKAEPFLKKTDLSIYDPFTMKDMDKAAARVVRAVELGENVAIMGDYDADGVSSTALLYLYLESLNPDMKLGYYIPDRFSEGYGMSKKAVDTLHKHGAQLIITVDTGITAIEEIDYANTLGIDVVVTDHHECREILPDALAVVDPHRPDCEYPFSDLAGVGVAFKLVTAVEALLRGETVPSKQTVMEIYRQYSDLAMLGTVADVMPVVDENRAIIVQGLEKLRRAPRPGLRALIHRLSTDKNPMANINTSTIGFGIGPRINAAGRMAHASRALELLLITENDREPDKAAEALADLLCGLNAERQKEEALIMKHLDERVEEKCSLASDRVLVIADDDWHPGVIGIAASKVAEKYGRPAILITFRGSTENAPAEHDAGRGSGRSIEGVNLIEAIGSCGEHLIKYGGHELAAGLSLERGQVDAFRAAINAYIKAHETEDMWTSTVKVDLELTPSDISMSFAENMTLLEPFGIANPTPLFLLRDVTVVTERAIGNGSHLKFRLEKDGVLLDAVMFHASYEAFGYNPGEKIDVLFNADVNEYNGSRTVQLVLRETRYSESYTQDVEKAQTRYQEICNGADFALSEDVLPTRNEFAVVYRLLRTYNCESVSELAEKQLFALVSADSSGHINRIKFRVILDVLHEMALCKIQYHEFDLIEFHVDMSAARVDLESSPFLRRLRAQCEQSS